MPQIVNLRFYSWKSDFQQLQVEADKQKISVHRYNQEYFWDLSDNQYTVAVLMNTDDISSSR